MPIRIAITTGVRHKPGLTQRYEDAIRRAGGEPRTVGPETGFNVVAFDGLLLSGGGDVNPRRYAEEAVPEVYGVDDARDELEFAAYRQARAEGLPVLAICRGFQLVNVAEGGSLAQHVDGHAASGGSAFHDIAVEAGSALARLLDTFGDVGVNSRHHQAVTPDRQAPTLRASAISTDGLVEALEGDGWLLGVQCHPERENEVDPRFERLFRGFVEAAGARAGVS